jgi:hypothetical protein
MICKVHQNTGVDRIVGMYSDEWLQSTEFAIENYSIQSLSGSSKIEVNAHNNQLLISNKYVIKLKHIQ